MTSATETRRADLMRKIRALVAKADDRSVTPEEADIFRDKADELMTKYAVEEYELLVAEQNMLHAPESRRVDMTWWYTFEGDHDARQNMWLMFSSVYTHCRCISVFSSFGQQGRSVLVAGFPGDLDWADLLFTSLFLQLERAVNPKPSPSRDYFTNLCDLRAAGLSWPEVYHRMMKYGAVPPDVAHITPASAQRDQMIRDYRRLCKVKGVEQNYAHWKTFRRSFSDGFVSQVHSRLSARRREDEQRTTDDGNSFALVLRDVRTTVQEWLYEQGIMERPVPQPAMDTVAKGKRVSYPKDTRKNDWSAYQAGMRAGDQADISGSPGRRINGEKGLLDG